MIDENKKIFDKNNLLYIYFCEKGNESFFYIDEYPMKDKIKYVLAHKIDKIKLIEGNLYRAKGEVVYLNGENKGKKDSFSFKILERTRIIDNRLTDRHEIKVSIAGDFVLGEKEIDALKYSPLGIEFLPENKAFKMDFSWLENSYLNEDINQKYSLKDIEEAIEKYNMDIEIYQKKREIEQSQKEADEKAFLDIFQQ